MPINKELIEKVLVQQNTRCHKKRILKCLCVDMELSLRSVGFFSVLKNEYDS